MWVLLLLLSLVSICVEYLFPALHFQSVCVPCFEVGVLQTAYIGVFFLYPFSQSLSFGWGIHAFTFKVIIGKHDAVAIYCVVLGSSL